MLTSVDITENVGTMNQVKTIWALSNPNSIRKNSCSLRSVRKALWQGKIKHIVVEEKEAVKKEELEEKLEKRKDNLF